VGALEVDATEEPGKTRVKALLKAWIASGALKVGSGPNPNRRGHDRPTVIVGNRVLGCATLKNKGSAKVAQRWHVSYCATTLPPKGGGKVVTQRHVAGEGDAAFRTPATRRHWRWRRYSMARRRH
jgi:hypothetical protein